uniref:Protein kinase domain-containing protein n=1 Tax=Kalanchoe fedtschenkoi TaxID=63787 RepID=A0A7N0TW17_KALFE
MEKTRRLDFVLLRACVFATWMLVRALSDQSGFISIDCGSSRAYSDATTGVSYVPDTGFIDSGMNGDVSTQYKTNDLQTQFENVRSFPNGDRNCYTLKPQQVAGTQYFMRAQFMYGNYDSKGQAPEFDLYIGVNLWATIRFSTLSDVVTEEMIHVPSKNVTNVCLVNTANGTPFISVLELRLMDNSAYMSQTGTLNMLYRLNLGSESGNEVRYLSQQSDSVQLMYPDDSYDRIWKTIDWTSNMNYLSTNETIMNNYGYKPPVSVLRTAVTPKNASDRLQFYWSANMTDEQYIYLHFAEVEDLAVNQSRQFNIYLNDTPYYGPFTPPKLSAFTVFSTRPLTGTWFNFSLNMTETSTLPPIINAIEIYKLNLVPQLETNAKDGQALFSFIAEICCCYDFIVVLYINNVKSTYGVNKLWQGDPCAPRNYSWDGIDCSFSGFDEPRIIALNLKGNNLTGPVPAELIKKSQAGLLTLSGAPEAKPRETLEPGNHHFTYSQVLTMTRNFERVIGKGGFGTVYHGDLNGTQVAVKMLSASSSQGYKEFQAEAKLLMRVHHRNLTSLIGYCIDGDKLGLIYEYMANGNLEMNISSKNREYLTWEDRLYIAVDAAQGLEYLHNGCKPPIVHRDIKSTNILLNDQFQAKLADFGLSRAFPTDESPTNYVASRVVGTPGYLDPEYYNRQMLSEKSDVYSFGVVLLEIITSEP